MLQANFSKSCFNCLVRSATVTSSPAAIVAITGGGTTTPDGMGSYWYHRGCNSWALNGLPGTTLGEWNVLQAVALPLIDCLTTDLDNLSKNPFFFLTVSFSVDSGEVSGDKNAPSSDDTEKTLYICRWRTLNSDPGTFPT